MSAHSNFATYASGAVVGSALAIIPDEAIHWAAKLVFAVLVASLSGLVHGFARRLASGKRGS